MLKDLKHCLLLLLWVITTTSCSNSDNNRADNYTFRSLKQSFDAEVIVSGKAIREQIEINFVKAPKFTREKMVPSHNAALSVEKECDKILDIIRAVEDSLDALLIDSSKRDDRIVRSFMVDEGRSKRLKNLIDDALENMLDSTGLRDTRRRQQLREEIKGKHQDVFGIDSILWSQVHFQGSGDKAKMELSRLKLEFLGATKMVVDNIIEGANSGTSCGYSRELALAIPNTSFLISGDRLEASVLLAMLPDTAEYKLLGMRLGGKELDIRNGVGSYAETVTTPGMHRRDGSVSFIHAQDNYPQTRNVRFEYFVWEPVVSVKTTGPRIIYAGVPNQLDIRASGLFYNQVHVTVDKGTLTGIGPDYVLEVEDTGIVTMSVCGKFKNGLMRELDTVVFEVRRPQNQATK